GECLLDLRVVAALALLVIDRLAEAGVQLVLLAVLLDLADLGLALLREMLRGFLPLEGGFLRLVHDAHVGHSSDAGTAGPPTPILHRTAHPARAAARHAVDP